MADVYQIVATDAARETLISIADAKMEGVDGELLESWADWLMIELWTRGYVIVPFVSKNKLDS